MTQRCALTSPVTMKQYLGDSPSLSTGLWCLNCSTAPRPFSSSHPPVLGKLRRDEMSSLRLRTAASHPSQTFIAARVRAVYTRLPQLSKYSITSSRIEAYRALPASRWLMLRCSSPILVMPFYSARVLSACSSSAPENAECVNCKKSSADFRVRATG